MKRNALSLALTILTGVTITAQASVMMESSPLTRAGLPVSIKPTGPGNIDPVGRSSYTYVVSLAAGQTFTCPEFSAPNTVAKMFVSSAGGVATELWTMRSYRAWNIRRNVEDKDDQPPVSAPWCFTAPTAGEYKIEYLVLQNTAPHGVLPESRFPAVPEPSTWVAGALLGAVMLFGFLRNHRRVA